MSARQIGMAIRRLRTRKKLTQAQLAAQVPCHRIYLAQIEAGTKTPSIATLEKIAKALRVKVARLLE
jgi:transcriptional regulator with XRE-family HTH domain